jgi:hypothetical protein
VRQVSKDEFYKAVGPLNVHPNIVTGWPYTSEWRLQNDMARTLIGKTILRQEGGQLLTDYFLVNARIKETTS